jgi:hypothetical protein
LFQGFESVTHVRGTQLIGNNTDHTPFVLMERKGQLDEAYRRIDCTLIVTKKNICENCAKLRNTMYIIQKRILAGIHSAKTIHASKEILIEKVNKQRKIIKGQSELIVSLKECLEEKIKKEEVEVSDKIANITHIITKDVINKNINFSTLHPIFQELIRIQTGKPNGTRYHPM